MSSLPISGAKIAYRGMRGYVEGFGRVTQKVRPRQAILNCAPYPLQNLRRRPVPLDSWFLVEKYILILFPLSKHVLLSAFSPSNGAPPGPSMCGSSVLIDLSGTLYRAV